MAYKLRFVLGPSFSGKTGFIHREIIDRSFEEPEQNLLLIVPDQYTLASQIEMVERHPDHVITNIDVLSFGRLSHRILEETGRDRAEVIDDTGKSLIIRREAGAIQGELPLMAKNLRRPGYIHEIKAILSEFMLYGVGQTELDRAIADPALPPGLKMRLSELSLIYGKFNNALGTDYTTREDRLMVLSEAVPESEILRGARVYFDGFTGFTPLQVNVIREMLSVCESVTVSLLWDHGNRDVTSESSEESLFHMSRQTIDALSEAAGNQGVSFIFSEDVWKTADNTGYDTLKHLEKHLFREKPVPEIKAEPDRIRLFRYRDQRSEIEGCAREITRYIRDTGARYSDIAVITGDLAGYAEEIQDVFSAYGIPVYMDYTRGVSGNALSVFLRSAMELVNNGFRADSVMRFLKTGLVVESRADEQEESTGRSDAVDVFERYIRKCGLRGKNAYQKPFSENEGAQEEQVRRELVRVLEPLINSGKTVESRIRALYEVMLRSHCAERLERLSEELKNKGESQLSSEYGQIYGYIIGLFDIFISLMGGEEVTDEEFRGLFEAGISELRVGTIPQDQDRITVGDLERTRINRVRFLFVLGCDDTSLPGNSAQGGLLSETDREVLSEAGLTLSPSQQELMFSQRMYLYMNLTKACESLYISWPDMGSGQSVCRPSYLIGEIRRVFPGITVTEAASIPENSLLITDRDLLSLLSSSIRFVVERGTEDSRYLGCSSALIRAFNEAGLYGVQSLPWRMVENAFHIYEGKRLSGEAVEALYGRELRGSVTKIETFGKCPYMYFLNYGLNLREAEEYGIRPLDTGNYLHKALERFGRLTDEAGVHWGKMTDEELEGYALRALEDTAAGLRKTAFFGGGRDSYVRERLFRILLRSVKVIRYQIAGGSFTPKLFEEEFRSSISPENGLRMEFWGKIDRIDRAVLDGIPYIRVIDYKTGSKSYKLERIRAGLDVQLPLYLRYAVDMEEGSLPAGMFYFHVFDPITSVLPGDITGEAAEAESLKKYQLNGSVVAEEKIAHLMQREGVTGIIPKVLTRDNSPDRSKKGANITREEMDDLIKDAEDAVKRAGNSIIEGDILASPMKDGNDDPCVYCAYRASCIYEKSLPGFSVRTIKKMTGD